MQWLLLGYDIDRSDAAATIAELRSTDAQGADHSLIAAEHQLLGLFDRSELEKYMTAPELTVLDNPQAAAGEKA